MMPAEILMVSGQILVPKEDRHTESFVPLVFEYFGRWGEKAERFLKELSKESADEGGHPNTCEFVGYWRKRLSLQIQKCNAGVIFRKLNFVTD